MTKADQKQIDRIVAGKGAMPADAWQGMAARAISSMIRSAMSGRTAAQLLQVARELKITSHPEFII